MKTIVCNDFSLEMINRKCIVAIEEISLSEFIEIIETEEYQTIIGNKFIAKEFGLEFNKGEINLNKNTRLIVVKPTTIDSSQDNYKYKFYSLRCC